MSTPLPRQATRQSRTLAVRRKEPLTPNMTRVTLAGPELAGFPQGFEGGYVKLVFPNAGARSTVRSYTVREFRQAEQALVLDMVSHGDTGPATAWVNRASVGEEVVISGPGACQPANQDADWYLLAGDMSAIPAIAVNLERLPRDATGHLVLEVISEADKIELARPDGIDVEWIVNPKPESPNSVLEDTVMALPWRSGRVSVWVAGEFSASRALRQYFRHHRSVPRECMYVSCYWKIGDTDEGMKAAKRADPEPW